MNEFAAIGAIKSNPLYHDGKRIEKLIKHPHDLHRILNSSSI